MRMSLLMRMKGPSPQKTLHLFNASGGTENLFFMRKVKIEIGRFFICKVIGNAVGKVMSVDNSFTYIRRTQKIESV